MCLTVDVELTREVRELLDERAEIRSERHAGGIRVA